MNLATKNAADVLLGGGVIAYPTDGVFGLGCLPGGEPALRRLLEIKHRDPAKGFILLAASAAQLSGWVDEDEIARLPVADPEKAITWIVRPGPNAGPLLCGSHSGIAVRITTNPVAAAICNLVDSPITSTSANLAGRPVVRNRSALLRHFRALVDYVVPGECGPGSGPSEIRRLEDDSVLRPGNQ